MCGVPFLVVYRYIPLSAVLQQGPLVLLEIIYDLLPFIPTAILII